MFMRSIITFPFMLFVLNGFMYFRSRQAKALIKEMKQWAEILPVHPHAAVFVRQVTFFENKL